MMTIEPNESCFQLESDAQIENTHVVTTQWWLVFPFDWV